METFCNAQDFSDHQIVLFFFTNGKCFYSRLPKIRSMQILRCFSIKLCSCILRKNVFVAFWPCPHKRASLGWRFLQMSACKFLPKYAFNNWKRGRRKRQKESSHKRGFRGEEDMPHRLLHVGDKILRLWPQWEITNSTFCPLHIIITSFFDLSKKMIR